MTRAAAKGPDKVKTLNRRLSDGTASTFKVPDRRGKRFSRPHPVPTCVQAQQGSDDAQSSLKNSPSADLADASVLDSVAKMEMPTTTQALKWAAAAVVVTKKQRIY